jgi:hypothetical protein
MNGWARSWMGLEEDLPRGEQLLALFRPFLENLAASDLSPKAIQKHVDNMWALGGEFMRAYWRWLRYFSCRALTSGVKTRAPKSGANKLRGAEPKNAS